MNWVRKCDFVIVATSAYQWTTSMAKKAKGGNSRMVSNARHRDLNAPDAADAQLHHFQASYCKLPI